MSMLTDSEKQDPVVVSAQFDCTSFAFELGFEVKCFVIVFHTAASTLSPQVMQESPKRAWSSSSSCP